VPEQFVDVIKSEPRQIEIQDGYVEISLMPVARKEYAPKKHDGAPKFEKKKFSKNRY
jgi:hypothetical protein